MSYDISSYIPTNQEHVASPRDQEPVTYRMNQKIITSSLDKNTKVSLNVNVPVYSQDTYISYTSSHITSSITPKSRVPPNTPHTPYTPNKTRVFSPREHYKMIEEENKNDTGIIRHSSENQYISGKLDTSKISPILFNIIQ